MAYTISIHNGSQYSQKHNNRTKEVCEKEKHIDLERSHYTFMDVNVHDAYARLFAKSLNDYNQKIKSKHPERVKTMKQYINELYAKKDNAKNSTKLVYEIIVQVGNLESAPNDRQLKKIYYEYAKRWAQRNPNLKMIGCYMHFDEEGSPHMHIDYIPYAKCTRGMEYQPNLTQALKSQGFDSERKSDTAQIRWEKSEREVLREICKEYEVETRDSKTGRKHMETEVYKLFKRLENLKEQTANQVHLMEQREKELIQIGDDIEVLENYKKELIKSCQELRKQQEAYIKELEEITKPTSYEEVHFISEIPLDF